MKSGLIKVGKGLKALFLGFGRYLKKYRKEIKGAGILILIGLLGFQALIDIRYVNLVKVLNYKVRLEASLKYELEHNISSGNDLYRIIRQYFYGEKPKPVAVKPDSTKK